MTMTTKLCAILPEVRNLAKVGVEGRGSRVEGSNPFARKPGSDNPGSVVSLAQTAWPNPWLTSPVTYATAGTEPKSISSLSNRAPFCRM
jgi:hypothetical protein